MLVVGRIIVNCFLILTLTYVGLSKNLTDCLNGEQGIETTQALVCDPLNGTQSKDCKFNFILDPQNYKSINCLKITNQDNDSDADNIIIKMGGVGSFYVSGDVFSKPGKGINYTINVWANSTTETTTPEVTTAKISTTTDGSAQIYANLVLLFCVNGFYVLRGIV